jgi:protein-tyrosine phosphatase
VTRPATGGERRIDLRGTTNLRDVGGYRLAGGGQTAWGLLYRSDVLVDPDGSARPHIARLGLRTVVDLRPERERTTVPSGWSVAPFATLESVPIPDGVDGDETGVIERLRSGDLRRFDHDDLADFYVRTLEQRAPEYGRAITLLGQAGALPALVHCAAGKDRTGLLVALVLEGCGVVREDVLSDFALTERYRPNRIEVFRERLEELGTVPEDVASVFACPPEALAMALDHVIERDGSVLGYLLGPAGVPGDAWARLRGVLTGRTLVSPRG